MKEIKLSKGYVALVDDDDYDMVSKFNWYASKNVNVVYAKSRGVYMHRFILDAKKGELIDHVDGNGLNNQRCNIRLCNRAQNLANSIVKNRKCAVKYRGVYVISTSRNYRKDGSIRTSPRVKKYCVEIRINKQKIFLGYYATPEEAALVYNEAALKHYGEFARLNIIE